MGFFLIIKFIFYLVTNIILNIIETPFYLWMIPCMRYIENKAEKERIKRLSESTVKHKALDIVAS